MDKESFRNADCCVIILAIFELDESENNFKNRSGIKPESSTCKSLYTTSKI